MAKLATFIANYELFQIEVNKAYDINSFRTDLKKVLKVAGADCKHVVFLFTDTQIKDESFLEDISMILNTGEVPNLYQQDEKTEILERVQVATILMHKKSNFFLNLLLFFSKPVKHPEEMCLGRAHLPIYMEYFCKMLRKIFILYFACHLLEMDLETD